MGSLLIQLPNLVISGDSKIGSEIARALGAASTSRRIPVADGKIPFDLRKPSWLPLADRTFFCSGINGFKPCEENPDEARLINVTNTALTAANLVERGGKVVLLSSCAAETHPETVYGTLKLETESEFLKFGDRASIYRFGPVMFPGRNTYPNKDYHPISLEKLVHMVAFGFVPGLHRVLNVP